MTPDEVTAGSHKKAWWKCNKGHNYNTVIKYKHMGSLCPYCSGRRVCIDNCFICSKHGEVEGLTIWDVEQQVHTYCKSCCIDLLDGLDVAKLSKRFEKISV